MTGATAGPRRGHRGRPAARLGVALAALLAAAGALGPRPALADPLDGELSVESAFVNVADGVYQLHARVRYPANEDTQAALRDGVSLFYDLDVEIERERRWWPDAGVTAIALRRTLTYHAVTQRYVVRGPGREPPAAGLPDAGGGDEARDVGQQTFPTLDEALEYLGKIDGWPILVAPQVSAQSEYRVRVRARVRRGRLPDALRLLMFWTDDWNRESEWYSWSLPR